MVTASLPLACVVALAGCGSSTSNAPTALPAVTRAARTVPRTVNLSALKGAPLGTIAGCSFDSNPIPEDATGGDVQARCRGSRFIVASVSTFRTKATALDCKESKPTPEYRAQFSVDKVWDCYAGSGKVEVDSEAPTRTEALARFDAAVSVARTVSGPRG